MRESAQLTPNDRFVVLCSLFSFPMDNIESSKTSTRLIALSSRISIDKPDWRNFFGEKILGREHGRINKTPGHVRPPPILLVSSNPRKCRVLVRFLTRSRTIACSANHVCSSSLGNLPLSSLLAHDGRDCAI